VCQLGHETLLYYTTRRVIYGSQTDNDQGDHLSGKPGNAREFDSCQDFAKSQEVSGKKILSRKVA